MNAKKNAVKSGQMVCCEVLNFKPTTELPFETVKFVYHGPYTSGNVNSPKFHTPYLVASKEFVIDSEELIFFLSDWFGEDLDIKVGTITYEGLKSCLIGKRKNLNALLKWVKLVNTTTILSIAPYRGNKIIWPIKNFKIPSHLCNRVAFEKEDIGLHLLSSNTSPDSVNIKDCSPIIESSYSGASVSTNFLSMSENEVKENISNMEVYAKQIGVDPYKRENQEIIRSIAQKYYDQEIIAIRYLLRDGIVLTSFDDIIKVLQQNRIRDKNSRR